MKKSQNDFSTNTHKEKYKERDEIYEKHKAAIDTVLKDIASAKRDMETARQNFDCVFRREDVDIYIYKLRDAQSRYVKLLGELKALGRL